MNSTPFTKVPELREPIRRLIVEGFRACAWGRRVARPAVSKAAFPEEGKDRAQGEAQSSEIVLRRQPADNPTQRYDELARQRVTLLACRHGGPALEVGTGPCVCMASRLARCGMQVMAVDQDANAVISARRAASAPEFGGKLKVQQADARHLPFENGSYRVVVAFDCLGHASNPRRIVDEMFRVRSADGVVLITEYNEQGRRATRHRNFGFENRMAAFLGAHCSECWRIDHPHHVTYVCDANTRSRRANSSPDEAVVPVANT